MIDLTLQGFLVPNILGYDPPFGTKIETTPENKGGLTTREVNDNIMMPFAKQRPVAVTASDSTSRVDYDAKILIKGDAEAGTVTLTMGDGGYEGCMVTVICVSGSASVSASGTAYSMIAGTMLRLAWDGTQWIQPGAYGAVWN